MVGQLVVIFDSGRFIMAFSQQHWLIMKLGESIIAADGSRMIQIYDSMCPTVYYVSTRFRVPTKFHSGLAPFCNVAVCNTKFMAALA